MQILLRFNSDVAAFRCSFDYYEMKAVARFPTP
jgi:hypothetical protein